ncbi:MAG: SDR family oxidoreductase [Acidobacteriota bacterium]
MILVTGATGKVGQEVVRQLAAENVPVRALVRDPAKASHIRLPGVEIAVGDLGRPETLDPALDSVDRVFLLSPPDPEQVALQGNLIEAARRAGARHIVKLSVAGGPDSGTQIGRWHWTTEKQIESSGIAFTFLRPTFYMQQMLLFAPMIAATGSFSLPMGTGEAAVVDTRDVAAVAVAALTKDGHDRKIYDVTGPQALSFDVIADALSAATGKDISYVHVPPEYARKQLLGIGLPRWLADDMLVLCASFRDGYGAGVSSTVRNVARQEPRRFDQFARDYAPIFREGK